MLSRLLPLVALSASARASGSPADWPCAWSTFPKNTPSATWPDGPIVGNGNEGWAIGGAAGEMTLYGTVHGFWSNSLGKNSTMPPLAAPGVASGFPSCPGPTCNITVVRFCADPTGPKPRAQTCSLTPEPRRAPCLNTLLTHRGSRSRG